MTSSDSELRHSSLEVDGSVLHIVEGGDPAGKPFVLLHGWPQSWRSWQRLMERAADRAHPVALDLPGVGASTGDATDGSKRRLADLVHSLITTMELTDVTLVGHDIGGMVVYSYLRAYDDLSYAVIADVVIPGLDPWAEVLRNPYLWHFALHSVPDLPERLVQGRQREYFDYFYETLAADGSKITEHARADYVEAYATDTALTAGINWYRAFQQDAKENERTAGQPINTPVLYFRGEQEGGDISAYIAGFEHAGLEQVQHRVIRGAGHFTPEEAPDETWRSIANFAGLEEDGA